MMTSSGSVLLFQFIFAVLICALRTACGVARGARRVAPRRTHARWGGRAAESEPGFVFVGEPAAPQAADEACFPGADVAPNHNLCQRACAASGAAARASRPARREGGRTGVSPVSARLEVVGRPFSEALLYLRIHQCDVPRCQLLLCSVRGRAGDQGSRAHGPSAPFVSRRKDAQKKRDKTLQIHKCEHNKLKSSRTAESHIPQA